MKRQIEITLEQAKQFYKQGGNLKEIALLAFTENELTDIDEMVKLKMYQTIEKECGFDITIKIAKLSDLEDLPCLSNDNTLQAIFDFFWSQDYISCDDIWFYLLNNHKPSEKLMLEHLENKTLDFTDVVISLEQVDFVKKYHTQFNFNWDKLLEEHTLTFPCIQAYMEFFKEEKLIETQVISLYDIKTYIKNEIGFGANITKFSKEQWERFFTKKHSLFFVKNLIENLDNIVSDFSNTDGLYFIELICVTQPLDESLIMKLKEYTLLIWQYLSYNPYLSTELIRKYKYQLNMDLVNQHNNKIKAKKKVENLVGLRFTETELETKLNEIFGIEVELHNEEYEESNIDDCFFVSPNEDDEVYTLFYIETKEGKFYITEVAVE